MKRTLVSSTLQCPPPLLHLMASGDPPTPLTSPSQCRCGSCLGLRALNFTSEVIFHGCSFQVSAMGTFGYKFHHIQRSPRVVWSSIRYLQFVHGILSAGAIYLLLFKKWPTFYLDGISRDTEGEPKRSAGGGERILLTLYLHSLLKHLDF